MTPHVEGEPSGRLRGLPLSTGSRVGEWEIIEPIASGNFGSVYAARHVGLGNADWPDEVAVKIIPTRTLAPRQSQTLVELARREVEVANRLSHPRLVRVLDSIVLEDDQNGQLDGALALIMERAAGSLAEVLENALRGNPLPQASRLIVEICEGLAALHSSGWVHGDIKPANVLLTVHGSVLLADFGLVASIDGTHGYAPPLGTLDYLPPERHGEGLGDRGVAVRTSADIWALGVTAHQILTGGILPFPGSSPAARTAAAQEYAEGRAHLRLGNNLPEPWRIFVADCLAPTHRIRAQHTASEMLERARSLDESTPKIRPSRIRRRMLLTAFGCCLTMAGGAAVVAHLTQAPHNSASDAVSRATVVRVYNIEDPCRQPDHRIRSCSLGLALDPRKKYQVGNISDLRVWHGDALTVDCTLYDGERVADETGNETTRWYRVVSPAPPEKIAWLPAVRTRDDPKTPRC